MSNQLQTRQTSRIATRRGTDFENKRIRAPRLAPRRLATRAAIIAAELAETGEVSR